MTQCVNTFCLQQNSEGSTYCQNCGSQLIISGRLRATKLLSDPNNPFTPPETKTFEAIALDTQETVVLRVVHSNDPQLATALLESVLCLRQVHSVRPNPGIMQLAEKDTEQDEYFTWQVLPGEPPSHFMVARKVEGIPLDQWFDRAGTLDEETAAEWLRQLIEGVDALHKAGFVHQDIKPENIVFGDEYSQPVLIDLGAIRYINPRESINPDIRQGTAEYTVVGTPGYQAPEQAQGYPNHTSDYYSIGRVLIHLLTGQHPMDLPKVESSDGSSKLAWRDRVQISTPLADLIDRLAAANQIYRPSTARDIVEYLNDLQNLPAVRSPPQETRRRWSVTVAQAVAFALVIAGVLLAATTVLSESRSIANRLFSQANRLISTGAHEQAVPVLERAIHLAPDNADIRATLGLAYAISGDIEEAIDSYNAALELRPDDFSIRYNLASVQEQVDPQQAIANYQIAAQERSPVRDDAINNLARVYILQGELAQADVLLRLESEDFITQAVLYKNRGWLRFEQGELEQALVFLRQSIDLDPTRPDAYCLMSIIQRQQGRPSWDDETTCLSLPAPEDKLEVQRWKMQLLTSREKG